MTEEEMRELHHFEVEQILSEIQEVLKPNWAGHDLPRLAHPFSEDHDRISAIVDIMERWNG